MLKLRYLLLQGVDPIPLIKDDFPESVLELLRKPYKEIYNIIRPQNLTYLSCVGILSRSKFLYDYLMTLTDEQFDTETNNIRYTRYIHTVEPFTEHEICRAAGKRILNNHSIKLQITDEPYLREQIVSVIALSDLEYADKLGFADIESHVLLEYTDLTDEHQADLYIFHAMRQGEFEPEFFIGSLASSLVFDKYSDDTDKYLKGNRMDQEIIDKVAKYLVKLRDLRYDENELAKMILENDDYSNYYEIEAEAILKAFPDLIIVNYLNDEILQEWWQGRIDI